MATTKLGFAGRVAVITGAGGGLGREYALEFARRGASVVVNDLGGTFMGEGKSTNLADKVVTEIISEGGKAVANYDSVEEGEKIINTAIEHFGKVDILINNAGILRDRSFQNMSESDWDKVFGVHVKGAFKVTKAAWSHMRKRKYGRIIMTTSPAGLYGNFGQSNYSAAKMALHGLCKTLSIEGKKNNIFVNTIAPLALTRMTADIMPGADLHPRHVAPFVVYLCHETCTETGSLVEAAGGYACKTRLQRSQGGQLRKFVGDYPDVECVAQSWDRLTDFSISSVVPGNNESARAIVESMEGVPEHPLPQNASDVEKMKAHRFQGSRFMYTSWDVIRYALGVGAGLPDDGAFLYEGHPNFSAIPSFAACMGQSMVFQGLMTGLPELRNVDISRVVHGEHYIELMKPIPTSGEFTSRARIVDCIDKRKFIQLIVETEVFDEKKEVISKNQFVVLFLGASGVGRRGRSDVQVLPLPAPNRTPDASIEEKTGLNQAALYRLNGDPNPLHIDKEFANMTGFDVPILHGLCTFGFGLRHVLKTYADNDVSLFKSIKGQFSKPVIPGQTLVTEMWCEGKRVHFQVKVKENNNTVVKGAYVDFHKDVSKKMTTFSALNSVVNETNDLKAEALFSEVENAMSENADLVKSVKASFLFQVTKDDTIAGQYLLDFKSPTPSISSVPGTPTADVTIRVSDDNLVMLAEGKLNPISAFMQGKIKVSGQIGLAQKLDSVFKIGKKPKKTSTTAMDSTLKASKVFNDLKDKLKENLNAVKNVKGKFLFKVMRSKKLAGEWLLDFNQSPPIITASSGSADVTITIEDDDFEALALGKLNSMQAFMQGKLKATGKIMLAQKLGDVFKTYSSKL